MDTRIELTLGTGRVGRPDVTSDAPVALPSEVTAPVVVVLRGELSTSTAAELTDRLCALLRDHGAVVADVTHLRAGDLESIRAFVDAVARAGEWPDVRLAIAAPDPGCAGLLEHSGVDQQAPVHRDVRSAIAALDQRPRLVRSWWHFDPDPRAPGDARGHVRRVCRRWDIDDEVREAAEIVVTELVTNAVEHAGSASLVEVERREHSFRLTVRDYDRSAVPAAHLPAPTSSRGRGLAMVAAVARDWGVEPHSDGKTVWAEMAPA